MSYIDLNKAKVDSSYYFVDANVWIYALQEYDSLDFRQKKYSNFFYDIIDSNLNPKPQILLPVLLISEVINTYLRQIAMSEYKINNVGTSTPFEFKRHYRKTQHYDTSFEKIIDDIKAFHACILLVDDRDVVEDSSVLLGKSITPFDYNDYFYYLLCKKWNANHDRKVIILTNDGDFQISDPDIKIITSNKNLLNNT